MELAPTGMFDTITWSESDLNREALALQRFLMECIVPDTNWLDPGDRPHIMLKVNGIPMPAQAGCASVDHDTIFMVVGVSVNSPVPPYPTHFLGFVKSHRSKWVLHDECVRLTVGDEPDVQDQANHALALLLLPTSLR